MLPLLSSGENKRIKRARTQQQDETGGFGRTQLLLTFPKLQIRLGRKFVDEIELVPLLLARGLLRTIDSAKVTFDTFDSTETRTEESEYGQALPDASSALEPGRDQLLIMCPTQALLLGKKYCDEAELVPLLLAHGQVRRMKTIGAEVRPLGGDNFNIRLDAANPTVGEAKAEIAREHGISEPCQELYLFSVRADGGAVREDDADVELLDDDVMLQEGSLVALSVKEAPLVWRTFDEERVVVSEESLVATKFRSHAQFTLVTSGTELMAGTHYWEIEILQNRGKSSSIGVTRPNIEPNLSYSDEYLSDSDHWFMATINGGLYGNGKDSDRSIADQAGSYDEGDRVGVLLDLDNGSMVFFKNGVKHGPGYPAGSVTGPVVVAVHMLYMFDSFRLLPGGLQPRQLQQQCVRYSVEVALPPAAVAAAVAAATEDVAEDVAEDVVLGIRFREGTGAESGKLFVAAVRDDSAAGRTGQIHVGDELVSVNGQAMAGVIRVWHLGGVTRVIRQAGLPMALTFDKPAGDWC
jgi:hypothetical protein